MDSKQAHGENTIHKANAFVSFNSDAYKHLGYANILKNPFACSHLNSNI